jgi:hypothetical protein
MSEVAQKVLSVFPHRYVKISIFFKSTILILIFDMGVSISIYVLGELEIIRTL